MLARRGTKRLHTLVAVAGLVASLGARSVAAQTSAVADGFAFVPPAAAAAASPSPPPKKDGPPVAAPATTMPAASPSVVGAAPAPAQVTPTDAASSLKRVRASYEYGDIDDVVESARPVAEGRIPATPAERAHALRYLGIGLYLTGRAPGAEAAFFELLRLRADSTLDQRTTRPDVVTFFEQVRARHADQIQTAARENNHKVFVLNFLPPVGQFQNGQRGKGLVLAGVELASLATAVTTYALLKHWQQPDYQCSGGYDTCKTVRVVNWVSLGALIAAYGVGVLDALGNYSDLPDEAPSPGPRVALTPNGLALRF